MIESKTYVREEINGQLQERPIQSGEKLTVGTILITKLRITTRRDLDFVTIRDMRPACCEPLEQLSHYEWQGGLGYYVEDVYKRQVHRRSPLDQEAPTLRMRSLSKQSHRKDARAVLRWLCCICVRY